MPGTYTYPQPRRRKHGRLYVGRLVKQFVARRLALGLSQAELNFRMGLADRYIGKLERGLRTPQLYLAMLWADAVDCDLVLVPREVIYAAPTTLPAKQIRRKARRLAGTDIRQSSRGRSLLGSQGP